MSNSMADGDLPRLENATPEEKNVIPVYLKDNMIPVRPALEEQRQTILKVRARERRVESLGHFRTPPYYRLHSSEAQRILKDSLNMSHSIAANDLKRLKKQVGMDRKKCSEQNQAKNINQYDV